MRSNRLFAAATARYSHTCVLHALASFLARAWSARACDLRAAAAADGRGNRIIAQRLQNRCAMV
eukprot:2654237-Lingulodinium_polyedra.AAC.1